MAAEFGLYDAGSDSSETDSSDDSDISDSSRSSRSSRRSSKAPTRENSVKRALSTILPLSFPCLVQVLTVDFSGGGPVVSPDQLKELAAQKKRVEVDLSAALEAKKHAEEQISELKAENKKGKAELVRVHNEQVASLKAQVEEHKRMLLDVDNLTEVLLLRPCGHAIGSKYCACARKGPSASQPSPFWRGFKRRTRSLPCRIGGT